MRVVTARWPIAMLLTAGLACGATVKPAGHKGSGSASKAKPSADAGPGVGPSASRPEALGVLVGPKAVHPLGSLHVYGTDLGFSYEHQGNLFLMFGDTLPTPDDICNEQHNDDTIASVPREFGGSVPETTFTTQTSSPDDFVPIQLMRGGESLKLGFGQAPLTAWSDGDRVFAVFQRLELTRCGDTGAAPSCPLDDGFVCSNRIGQCQPYFNGVIPPLCNVETGTGCFATQQCTSSATDSCVDTGSSQHDRSVEGEIAAVAENMDIGVQRDDGSQIFDQVLAWPTNRFINVTSRTVAQLGELGSHDYGPGHGDLLVWGRPRYSADGTREARLYLMAHTLPLELDDAGKLRFEPRYFAGADPGTDEPRWSSRQSDAKPLAMDGKNDGDPHEALHIVNHSAITWLPAPIEKWVMLYGGGLSDLLVLDPAGSRYAPAPGAIMIRFADHPWGPWTPPEPHLTPGSPTHAGDAYGPGGFLYNGSCMDTSAAVCARADATISRYNNKTPSCVAGLILWDAGQLYGANIIDAYSGPNADGGFDVIWNASTWNPYAVVMLKSVINDRGGTRRPSPTK